MIALFDYDSLLYYSVYKICSFSDVRLWFLNGHTKEEMRQQILIESASRADQMTLSILNDIEDAGIDISSIEYYLTACKNSARKQLSPEYKKGRKRNKWVSQLRKYMIKDLDAITCDILEADDLIADRAEELRSQGKKFIVLSIDKDLKQIAGYHFNYQSVYEQMGEEKVYIGRKGISYVDQDEANKLLAIQMLMGDSCDKIQGIPGTGEARAKQILKGVNSSFGLKRHVIAAYYEHAAKNLSKPNDKLKELRDKLVGASKLPESLKDYREAEIKKLQDQINKIEFIPRVELLKNYRLLKLGKI